MVGLLPCLSHLVLIRVIPWEDVDLDAHLALFWEFARLVRLASFAGEEEGVFILEVDLSVFEGLAVLQIRIVVLLREGNWFLCKGCVVEEILQIQLGLSDDVIGANQVSIEELH